MLTSFRAWVVLAVLTLAVSLAPGQATRPKAAATQSAFPAYPTDVKFEPGKEVKIDDPQTAKGGLTLTDADPANHFAVYIPKDYDPERAFPIILNFHGLNSQPTTWPFKDQVGGKGYIIVGLEYLRPACYRADPNYEMGYVKRLITWLKASGVNVDTKMIFMAGFSQGGWHVAGSCDKFADSLAGIIISSAGRGEAGPKVAAYKGMPVLLTAGETDGNRSAAETGAQYFKSQGAEVTLEIFKGKGHEIDTGSAVMKQWLADNGPARQSRVSFAAAEKARKDGQLGAAYAAFTTVAKNPLAGEYKDKAEAAAAEIGTAAQKLIDDAEALITARKYPEARKAFIPITTAYAGSSFADNAKKRIDFIDKDPAVATDIKQAAIDNRADLMEAQAQAAEAKKDYTAALSLYESYVKGFPTSHHIEQVKKHLDELKADKTIMAAAHTQEVDRECRGLMNSAKEHMINGEPDKARPILEGIIKKYPDTNWAATAKTFLSTLK